MKLLMPRLLCFLFTVTLLNGCYTPRPASRAFIDPAEDWQIKELSGIQSGGEKVDVLVGVGLRIRVEPFNGIVKPEIFTIQTEFTTPPGIDYKFDPSLSFVTLPNGDTVSAKGFPCSNTKYDLTTFSSDLNIKGPMQLSDYQTKNLSDPNECFILFFDATPPSSKDKYSLHIKGVTKDGVNMTIPEIFFVEGVK
jgi:hypothetical protein